MTWVHPFDTEEIASADLLGGKGAALARMTRLGIPVPPGFTITTDACREYLAAGDLPDGLREEVAAALERTEEQTGRRFGDPTDPLLLSVRSGARFSMPGMMDTVLDLGLNPTTVDGLAAATNDRRFALDCWRRFTEMFAGVVLGVDADVLTTASAHILGRTGAADASALGEEDLAALVDALREASELWTGRPFPDDPVEQLVLAIGAVFGSWNGRRARNYRRVEGIPEDLGTAVNIQAMVFGNRDERSGTGVVFTRNPATGEASCFGDFLLRSQGEDVVAGTRHTQPFGSMATPFPQAYAQLLDVLESLEGEYRDMCDVEFTVESRRLWVLQTRVGKRSASAALRIAVEMVDEGLITRDEAIQRFSPRQLGELLHSAFAPDIDIDVLTTGLGASPGAASGAIVFTADDAVAAVNDGQQVLLVRPETSPEDLHGIVAAAGVLTGRGGLVSHAAVVARGLGRPAVCGAAALTVDVERGELRVGDVVLRAGDILSIDGQSGAVVAGSVPVVTPEPSPHLVTLLEWADKVRRLGIQANADTPADARLARAQGAEGIGLCRTEHMFLGDRLPILQDVILASTTEERVAALKPLHALQRSDFTELLTEMDGLPVTIRLLDPPLHEFLPNTIDLQVRRETTGLSEKEAALLGAVEQWKEHNPMLGVRGVRLAVLLPELYLMQVRALAEAALVCRRSGGHPMPQIMLPLVSDHRELAYISRHVRNAIDEVCANEADTLDMPIGTMIETPRAALLAGTLTPLVDFCSFGTNDLTQMTFGFSRDDIGGRLMPRYEKLGLLPHDPFASLDVEGVGELVRGAVTRGRTADSTTEMGVCGEHGGDPASIAFFDSIGIDHVSCSPHRLATARLSAAHAALSRPARTRPSPAGANNTTDPLHTLDQEACIDLLRAGYVGRLGYTDGTRPVIVTTNYRVMEDGAIAVASRPGSKLDKARVGETMSLQLDWSGELAHDGGSVLASGPTHVIEPPEAQRLMQRLRLRPWPGDAHVGAVIILTPTRIEGRQLR